MVFKVYLTHPNAKVPVRSSPHAAGYDLFAPESGEILPGTRKLINLHFKMEIDNNKFAKIYGRSSLAAKLAVDEAAGVIDPDYRGEVRVCLANFGATTWTYSAGDRIAQMVIHTFSAEDPVQVSAESMLDDTTRGDGGFGSTGK